MLWESFCKSTHGIQLPLIGHTWRDTYWVMIEFFLKRSGGLMMLLRLGD
jgi:hypothetical protein